MLNIQRNIDTPFLYLLCNWAFQYKKLKNQIANIPFIHVSATLRDGYLLH